MDNIKSLSLVMPAYKQENKILDNIKSLNKVLLALPYKHELIIVVDGFLDKTYERAKTLKSNEIKVLGYEKNKGKGYAVKYGMLEAKGDVAGFIDAGMDIDPTSISLLLDLMEFHNADIVIGSKLHPESRVKYPVVRRIMSWGYRTLTHYFFGLDIKDTQVGLKFFRQRVVKDVFPRILVKTFAFDIEVLAVARARGFKRIYEGPIKLDFTGVSSITSTSFWRIVLHMLWDTLAVFYRLRVLHYYDK